MKKLVVFIFIIILLSGCSDNSKVEKNNKTGGTEQKAICISDIFYVEEYNNIENKRIVEIYAKNDKLTKIVMMDIYTSPTYDEYVDSIAISYNRQMYESSKSTDGVLYEYKDDYDRLISTYAITYTFSKLTYAEKDEIGYQKLLDDDGNLLSLDNFVKLYGNNTGIKCTIENIK